MPPAAHARAVAYTRGGHWLLLWGSVVGVLASLLILKSGVLSSGLARLQARRPRPVLAAFVAAVVFSALAWVVQLPWSVYADWWRERGYGLTSQPFGGWLGEQTIGTVISAVAGGILFAVIYAVVRRSPHRWWAWAGAVTAAFMVLMLVIAPVLIEPIFNRYTPAPPGPVRDEVVALAKVSGVPSDKIFVYDGSKQSNRYTANVSGLFGSARVAMSDVMFRQGADLAEVRGVVGHEMGHYAHAHALWTAAAFSVLAVVAFWLIDRLFPVVQRWTGARDVAGIADPAGLPVVMIILTTLGLLATPLTNTISRTAESDADRFSLEHANEPDGLSKALVKTIAYRAATPGPVEEFVFYDHPSVGRRVRRAMDWKAAHPAGAPVAAR
ncbi:hypothetical protein tb265_03040 [Gemmatimonadetes bacterium T265]|nr:hypothetical protein tb265_03040 [Gemmatimonadetes bacterium T265]